MARGIATRKVMFPLLSLDVVMSGEEPENPHAPLQIMQKHLLKETVQVVSYEVVNILFFVVA